jgi:hypothetical protein
VAGGSLGGRVFMGRGPSRSRPGRRSSLRVGAA